MCELGFSLSKMLSSQSESLKQNKPKSQGKAFYSFVFFIFLSTKRNITPIKAHSDPVTWSDSKSQIILVHDLKRDICQKWSKKKKKKEWSKSRSFFTQMSSNNTKLPPNIITTSLYHYIYIFRSGL